MKKTVLRIGVAALLVLLGFAWERGRQLRAKPQTGFGQPACVSDVPRAWGQYRGGQQSGLAFEDVSGTLRNGPAILAFFLLLRPIMPRTGIADRVALRCEMLISVGMFGCGRFLCGRMDGGADRSGDS